MLSSHRGSTPKPKRKIRRVTGGENRPLGGHDFAAGIRPWPFKQRVDTDSSSFPLPPAPPRPWMLLTALPLHSSASFTPPWHRSYLPRHFRLPNLSPLRKAKTCPETKRKASPWNHPLFASNATPETKHIDKIKTPIWCFKGWLHE